MRACPLMSPTPALTYTLPYRRRRDERRTTPHPSRASSSSSSQDAEELRRTLAEAKALAEQFATELALVEDINDIEQSDDEESYADEEIDADEGSDAEENDTGLMYWAVRVLFRKDNHPRVKVVLRTGVYIGCIGLMALFLPRLVVDVVRMLTLAATVSIDSIFVRLGGLLCLLFGAYYVGAALDDLDGNPPIRFYRTTVYMRWAFATVCLLLVWSDSSGHLWLLGLAAINAASAAALHRHVR